MNLPPLPKRAGVTFRALLTGLDALVYVVVPKSWAARWVARRLRHAGMFASWIVLPDGSEWTPEGKPAPKE